MIRSNLVLRIKFTKDMFINDCECIEQGTVMNLKENKDDFVIYSDNGYVVGRYDYCLNGDIYKYFEKID